MKTSTGLKRYFSNTTWLMAERLLSMIAGLMIGIYVARYLGAYQFGLLNYALSFVALFSIVATLGLDQITVREFVSNSYPKESILGTVFWLKLSGAFVAIGAVSAGLYFSNNDIQTSLLVLIIAFGLIFQSFNVIDFYFQAKVLSKYVVISQATQLGISSIVKISLVLLQAKLFWFALIILLENAILAGGLLYFLRRNQIRKISTWIFDHSLARQLLKESWPLALSGLVATIYMKIDQVMIKEMLDAKAVGLYSVAVRLSEVWYFLPTIILKSLFPAILSIRSNHQDIYKIRLQQLHDLLSWLAFPIAILIFFYSDELVEFLYGRQFYGAGTILAVHIWAGIVVFPGNIRAYLIIIENRQITALIFRSMGAVLNVILNYYLIPTYGAIGAAWATLVSFIIPVLFISLFDQVIRLTVIMTIKSYCLPLRALIYRKSLYTPLSPH